MNNLFSVTYNKFIKRKPVSETIESNQFSFTKENGDVLHKAWLGYGLNAHYYNVSAKEPGMKTENYRLHTAITPSQFTELRHIESGRIFTLGETETENSMFFERKLLENGIPVAILQWETYYKD